MSLTRRRRSTLGAVQRTDDTCASDVTNQYGSGSDYALSAATVSSSTSYKNGGYEGYSGTTSDA